MRKSVLFGIGLGLAILVAPVSMAQSGDGNSSDQEYRPELRGNGEQPVQSFLDDMSVTITSKVKSSYVLDGIQFSSAPVFQTNVTMGLPEGFFVGSFHSYGLDDNEFSSNFADELDLYGGWNGSLRDLCLKSDIQVGVSASYFDLFPLGEFQGDIFKVEVSAKRPFETSLGTVTVYGDAEFMTPVNWPEKESGIQVSTGLRHSLSINDTWTVTHGPRVIHDTGAMSFDAGFVGEYRLKLDASVSDSVTLTPLEVMASTPLVGMDDSRETRMVFGTGVQLSF